MCLERKGKEHVGVHSPEVCMPDGQDNREVRCVRVWDLGAGGGNGEEAGGVCGGRRDGAE